MGARLLFNLGENDEHELEDNLLWNGEIQDDPTLHATISADNF